MLPSLRPAPRPLTYPACLTCCPQARKSIGYELISLGVSAGPAFEALKELDRAAAMNTLAAGVLARAAAADGGANKMAVTADNFSRHPHFPVVGVKSAK
eukprot:365020-Chlamydomonas_euryale.AAC.3